MICTGYALPSIAIINSKAAGLLRSTTDEGAVSFLPEVALAAAIKSRIATTNKLIKDFGIRVE